MDEQPRRTLDGKAFNRLPEVVKLGIVAKEAAAAAQAAAYQQRLRKRRKRAALYGAAASLVLGLLVDASAIVYLVLLVAVGAGTSLFVAYSRSGHILGMLLYGGGTVAVTLMAYVTGLMNTNPFMLFCSCLFFIGAGAFVGFDTEQERTKTDSF